ncbi:MAG: hypothetical protein GX287_02200 [Fusobacteria bacterium]|nr:hypothetical protein [Fusobacteriota bacterium]
MNLINKTNITGIETEKIIFDGFENFIVLFYSHTNVWKQTFKTENYVNILELKVKGTEVELKKIKKSKKNIFEKKQILQYKGVVVKNNIIIDKIYYNNEWSYLKAGSIIVIDYENLNKKFILNKL